MKIMKLFRNILIPIALLGSLLLQGCVEKEFGEITDLNLSRCLQPMNLSARVSASLGDVVTFSWDVTKDAEVYLLTVLKSDGSTFLSEEVAPGAVPFQKKLDADESYTFTVQARADGKGDSKLAEYGKTFKTFAVKDNLFLKVTASPWPGPRMWPITWMWTASNMRFPAPRSSRVPRPSRPMKRPQPRLPSKA